MDSILKAFMLPALKVINFTLTGQFKSVYVTQNIKVSAKKARV